jgi:hypothetical protein
MKTTIYSFTFYDIYSDQNKLSPRKGTREAIKEGTEGKGVVVEESAEEVDSAKLTDGWFDLKT